MCTAAEVDGSPSVGRPKVNEVFVLTFFDNCGVFFVWVFFVVKCLSLYELRLPVQ